MLDLIERILTGWTDLARRAGASLLIVIAIATAAAGWYAAKNLKVNTDTSAMIDPTLDFQVRAKELREAFPEVKNDIAVIVRAPTLDEADAFAAAMRKRALERPEIFDSVFAPSAEPFFRDNGLLYLPTDDLERRLTQMSKASGLFEQLIRAPTAGQLFAKLAENDKLAERSDLGREALSSIYAELAGVIEASAKGEPRPFSWMGALATEDEPEEGHVRMVYVTPKLDFSRLQPAKPALDELHAEIAAIEKSFDGRVETFITGDPALRADELAAVTKGMEISAIISFAAIGVLLLMCYRSAYLTLVTLAALIAIIVFAGAYAAAAVGELNLVSIAFIILLGGLGHEFSIHMLLSFQERRDAGQGVSAALSGTMREIGPALALAAGMTAIGFFAFIPTAFVGIAQLGLIAGVGILIAFVVTITFVPAALGAFGAAGRKFRAPTSPPGASPITTAVAIGVLALCAVSLFTLPKARFDADPMALRDPKSPSVIGFNHLFDSKDTVPYRLTVVADSEGEAAAAAARARALPAVGGVRTLADFIPADQTDKLDLVDFASGPLAFALDAKEDASGAPSAMDGASALVSRLKAREAGTPDRRLADALESALADPSQFVLIEKNIFAYWPALVERLRAQFNADFIDIASLPKNLKQRYLSASGKWRVDILPAADVRGHEARRAFVAAVATAFPDVSGGAIQTEKAGEVVSHAMLQATLIALGAIALILLALLRSLRDVALILFPLLLAALLTIAAGVVFDIPFNYANIIVLPLLLGTGVDAGIHLVMTWRHREKDASHFGASARRAVFYAALATVATFGSLMLSPHRGTASMGELLTFAIGFTLLTTLIVLPVAFRFLEGRRRLNG